MILISLFLITILSTNAHGVESMDDIIDQLERDLIEQEKELLNISREEDQKRKVNRSFSYNTQSVEVNLNEKNDLEKISKQISDIGQRIASIKDDYLAMKERFIERAESTNVTFIIKPPKQGLKGYRSILFTIDGITVVKFENNGTLWSPAKELNIFDSYLPHGKHKYLENHTNDRRT